MVPYIFGLMIGFIYRTNVDIRPVSLNSPINDLSSEQSVYQSQLFPDKTHDVQESSNLDFVSKLELLSTKWVNYWFIRYPAFVLGVGLIMLINFLPHQLDKNGLDDWTQNAKTTFMVFEHFIVALGISLVMIPMLFGKFRVLLGVLCWKYLAPLAKISFAVYIIHPIFIYINVFSRQQSFLYQDFMIVYSAIATTLLSFVLGGLLSITLESPILSIERRLLRKR